MSVKQHKKISHESDFTQNEQHEFMIEEKAEKIPETAEKSKQPGKTWALTSH